MSPFNVSFWAVGGMLIGSAAFGAAPFVQPAPPTTQVELGHRIYQALLEQRTTALATQATFLEFARTQAEIFKALRHQEAQR